MADDDITAAPSYDSTSETPPDASGGAPAAQRTPGKAIAALVCGILSLLIAGIVFGAIAIGLGIVARQEIKQDPALTGDRMALAGVITGAIGAVVWVVFVSLGIGPGFS
jgi:Zn-dependent protease